MGCFWSNLEGLKKTCIFYKKSELARLVQLCWKKAIDESCSLNDLFQPKCCDDVLDAINKLSWYENDTYCPKCGVPLAIKIG